jgi:peroxiredoxin-like protein
MAILEHRYTADVVWNGGREGSGSITPGPSGNGFPINVPPEFGGEGGHLNPEELMTSAIAGCYSITYGIVVANRRLPIVGFEAKAEGVVEQNGAAFKYREIVIRPSITLAPDATDDQLKIAEDMAHKCDAYCIVTNAVRASVNVTIEPTVVRA